ncbi:MAG: hypothetical protein WA709_14875 [Stellaceae bacterium]
MKNERDSLTRLNSSNPRTDFGVRIGAAPGIIWDSYYPALCPVTAQSAGLWERMALTDTILSVRLVNA